MIQLLQMQSNKISCFINKIFLKNDWNHVQINNCYLYFYYDYEKGKKKVSTVYTFLNYSSLPFLKHYMAKSKHIDQIMDAPARWYRK